MNKHNSKICYCNITYKCNNWCKNCISYNVKKHTSREVTLDDFQFFANNFYMGTDDVWTISGGEPTLSQQFQDIINFCHIRSHHINMYSNGRLLYFLPLDCLNKIERIIVPLYGAMNTHNEYVNASQAYQETMVSLKNIISNNRKLIDIKLLYQSDKDTESIFHTPEWEFICENEHFSITRVIKPNQNVEELRTIVNRAEKAISMLLDMSKKVRFYDLPVCMMSQELQERLKSYRIEEHHFNPQVICGSTEHRYKLLSFAKPTDILPECENCKLQSICSMIMQNYFCPMVTEGKIIRTTE